MVEAEHDIALHEIAGRLLSEHGIRVVPSSRSIDRCYSSPATPCGKHAQQGLKSEGYLETLISPFSVEQEVDQLVRNFYAV